MPSGIKTMPASSLLGDMPRCREGPPPGFHGPGARGRVHLSPRRLREFGIASQHSRPFLAAYVISCTSSVRQAKRRTGRESLPTEDRLSLPWSRPTRLKLADAELYLAPPTPFPHDPNTQAVEAAGVSGQRRRWLEPPAPSLSNAHVPPMPSDRFSSAAVGSCAHGDEPCMSRRPPPPGLLIRPEHDLAPS